MTRPLADVPERCGAEFASHPTRPRLIAVCTLPPGHDGDHDNLLPKPGVPR